MTITIEQLQVRQAELAALIEQLSRSPAPSTILQVPAAEIQLTPGERYAGAVLGPDGAPLHHLVLMPATPDKHLNWQDAMAWAAEQGGTLPSRQEQALLYANCRPHLEQDWHWSAETHEEDASYAWYCLFSYGGQYGYHKSAEGAAVAVRRVTS